MSLPGIPEEYTISEPELRSMVRESRNGGNFAVNLTWKLWPELFGEGNLCFNYNWYGGGQLNKQKMDPVRKEVCKKYVCYFFPEFKVEESWKERRYSRQFRINFTRAYSAQVWKRTPTPKISLKWSRVNKNGARKWVKIQKEKSFKLDLDLD